jgi:hypothetical protein
MRRFVIYVALLIVAFLIGFVPMWIKFRDSSSRLSTATHELNLARAQGALTSAVLDAQRGDYEPAREAASSFFTFLRAETDIGTGSTLSPTQMEAAQLLLTRRDEIITLLARNDPTSAAQLSDLYVSYRQIMNQ